jgi:hypothetical protein
MFVFQSRKVGRSGTFEGIEGALIWSTKRRCSMTLGVAYPTEYYVLTDDELSYLPVLFTGRRSIPNLVAQELSILL